MLIRLQSEIPNRQGAKNAKAKWLIGGNRSKLLKTLRVVGDLPRLKDRNHRILGDLGVVAVKKDGEAEGMHEVALMQETLAIALARATEESAQRIHRITMRVGPLSGAVPEALEFAFDVVAHGTIAEGAQFEIEPIPIVCYCPTCALEFTPADFFCECPRCEQPSAEVRRGRELELVSLEVS